MSAKQKLMIIYMNAITVLAGIMILIALVLSLVAGFDIAKDVYLAVTHGQGRRLCKEFGWPDYVVGSRGEVYCMRQCSDYCMTVVPLTELQERDFIPPIQLSN